MLKFSRTVFLSLALALGAGQPAFADDPPAELSRDRQRVAQALKEKNPQRAVKILEPWLKKRPDDIELANDYALTLAQMGRLDQARQVLEDALSRNPETSHAFQNLREILSHQAALSYAKAMGKKPPSAQVALKGGASPSEPPVVLAQVEPRPGATVEPPPRNVVPKAEARPESRPESGRPPAADPADTAKGSPSKAAEPAKAQAADTRDKADETALVSATQQWADAWGDKDFKRYVSWYSDKFQPQQHPTRAAWEAHRKPRVTRPDPILVKVSDIRVKLLPGNQAEVKFRQRYEAGSLKLNSSKTLVWTKESGGWKILREEGR
jgi:ketosteroid isomerase-like protein